ncbi:MAG: FHA domain-containing protein [Gammaproteobacteria bacterium]|nr:FHA domain-containing protein [Gammaproteobacteria bacterium]
MKLTLSFKGKVLKVYHLEPGETLVGRAPDAGVRIDSLALQPRHARIRWDGAHATVEDLSGGELLINHRRVQQGELSHGDLVQLGKHTLQVAAEEQAPEETARAEPAAPPAPAPDTQTGAEAASKAGWVQFLTGEKLGRTLRLDRGLTRIGRPGETSAVIARRDDGYHLSHLEGERRTRVGGEPLGETARVLHDGDIIEVGGTRLLFFLE